MITMLDCPCGHPLHPGEECKACATGTEGCCCEGGGYTWGPHMPARTCPACGRESRVRMKAGDSYAFACYAGKHVCRCDPGCG